MNNKGQTLAIFIIILPVILLLVCITIDLGHLYLEKKEMQNTIKEIINNELKNEPDKQRIINLINKNLENTRLEKIEVSSNMIIISITKQYNGLFPNILKNNKTINITYKGYKIDNNITIKKEWIIWLLKKLKYLR